MGCRCGAGSVNVFLLPVNKEEISMAINFDDLKKRANELAQQAAELAQQGANRS